MVKSIRVESADLERAIDALLVDKARIVAVVPAHIKGESTMHLMVTSYRVLYVEDRT